MSGIASTYFVADDGVHGRELWRRLPSGATELVGDLNTGFGSSDPGALTGFVAFAGGLYFRAETAAGAAFFRVEADGSVTELTDLAAYGSPSNYVSLTVFDNAIYFIGQPGGFATLVRITSAAPGTVEPVATAGASTYLNAANPVAHAGDLYFTAYDPDVGADRLVRIESGTGTATSIADISGIFNIQAAAALGDAIYVSANSFSGNGAELWRIDLDDGTLTEIDIAPGASWSSPATYPQGFVEFAGMLYFSAYDPATGQELHRFDAAGNHELVADLAPGPFDNSYPGVTPSGSGSTYFVFDNALYFTAFDPINGTELRRISQANAPSPATIETFDLNPGSDGSDTASYGFEVLGSTLFFLAYDATGSGRELYRIPSTGSGSGTPTLVADLDPAASSDPGQGGGYVIFEGALYFVAEVSFQKSLYRVGETGAPEWIQFVPASQPGPYELTVSQGALYLTFEITGENGREMYRLGAGAAPGSSFDLVSDVGQALDVDPIPGTAVTFAGDVYFSAPIPFSGTVELWRVKQDGSYQKIVLGDSFVASNAGANNGHLFEFNGALYFSATEGGSNDWELFRIDAPALPGDDVLAVKIDINTAGSSFAASGTGFIQYNGALYFGADDGSVGTELWRITSAGTPELVADLNPLGASFPGGVGGNLVVMDGKLWLVGYSDDLLTRTFFTIEDTGVVTVTPVTTVPVDLEILSGFTPFGNAIDGEHLYFAARDTLAGTGSELWRLNTDTGTVEMVAEINATGEANPQNLIVNGDELYFIATDTTYGFEVRRLTASNAALPTPVIETFDLVSGSGDGAPPATQLVLFDGAVYFAGSNLELNRILPGSPTVDTVTSPPPLFFASFPAHLTVFGGALYFSANGTDGLGNTVGYELFRIVADGFGGGAPELVADINPGFNGSNATTALAPVVFDGHLYFSATLDFTTTKLYRVNGGTGAVEFVADLPGDLDNAQPLLGVTATTLLLKAASGETIRIDTSGALTYIVSNGDYTTGSNPDHITTFDSNTAPQFQDDLGLPITAVTAPTQFENIVNAAPTSLTAGTPIAFAADHEGDWAGGTLTVTGLLAQDAVSLADIVVNLPSAPGTAVQISGAQIFVDAIHVGDYAASGNSFTATFNAAAWPDAINAVINALHYANSSDIPAVTRDLTVTLTDSHGLSSNLTLTVNVNPENDSPVQIGPFNVSTNEDIVYSGSAATTDPDGDDFGYILWTAPSHGFVNLNTATGTFTYTPGSNQTADVSFIIAAEDLFGGHTEILFNVDVIPQNDAPDAVNDSFVIFEDTPVNLVAGDPFFRDVLLNDTDADTGDTRTIVSVTDSAHGTVTLVGQTITYTPDLNYTGLDTFTYTIQDSGGLQDTATVTLTVLPVNDVPIANNDVAGLPVRPDVLLVTPTGTSIHLNDGAGNLPDTGRNVEVPALVGTNTMLLGDFDADGDLDAVGRIDASDLWAIWRNNGAGGFASPGAISAIAAPNGSAIAMGDVNGDGDLDLVTQATSGLSLLVSENNGAGAFNTAMGPAATEAFTRLALADIDGDNDLDLVASGNSGTRFFTNNGAGVFTASGGVLGTGPASDIALADLDGDGDNDLVLTSASGEPAVGQTDIYLNSGTGTFTLHASLDTTTASTSVEIADLDGDSDRDLFITTPDDGARVYKNNGAASFTSTGQVLGPAPDGGRLNTTHVALADFDGDGDLDAVMTDGGPSGTGAYLFTNDGTGLFSSTQISSDTTVSFAAAGNLDAGGLARDNHDQAASDAPNTAVTGNVLVNDIDVDNATIFVVGGAPNVVRGASFTPIIPGTTFNGSGNPTSIVNGDYGTLTINNATGAYSYVVTDESLGAGFTGTDVFSVRVSDGVPGSFDDSTLTIHVTGSNDAPTFDNPTPEFRTAGVAYDTGSNNYTLNPNATGLAGGIFTGVDMSKDLEIHAKLFFGSGGFAADGIAFVIQNADATAIGGNAHFFGVENAGTQLAAAYPDYNTGYDDLGPSFGIKFDTFNNPGIDTLSGHHAQFFYGGRVNGENQAPLERIDNAQAAQPLANSNASLPDTWKDVTVSWDADTHTLTYKLFDGSFTGVTDSIVYDVVANSFANNPFAFAGFTGSGGGATAEQKVIILSVEQDGTPLTPPYSVERVSVSSSEGQANDSSQELFQGLSGAEARAMSGDGRYVAFATRATNLDPADTNAAILFDVFVRDLQTGTTTLLSAGGNASSNSPSISADGRFIAFETEATNLPGVPSAGGDRVAIYDQQTGLLSTVPLSGSYAPSLSGDGRYVAFVSQEAGQPGDTNGNSPDIFVFDRTLNTTSLLTAGSAVGSFHPSISGDGRYVAFEGDSNGITSHIFIRDTVGATTTLVTSGSTDYNTAASISADGRYIVYTRGLATITPQFTDIMLYDRVSNTTTNITQSANGDSFGAAISADGAYITFESRATNLTASDPNGAMMDVYRYTVATGQFEHITRGADASISADGQTIAFYSGASNLVAGDDNIASDVFVAQFDTAPVLGFMAEHTLGVIGTAKASDVDTGDTLTYSITSGLSGITINAATGEISVAEETALDYERELALSGSTRVEITVRVTDAGGLFDEKTFAIQILNPNPDDVHGTARDEIIYGGALADTLRGGAGLDELHGGLGNDTLTGGADADTIVRDAYDAAAAQSDTITDFAVAEDKIDLGTVGPASFEVLVNHLLRTNGSGHAELRGVWNSNLQLTTMTGVTAGSLSASNFIFDTSGTARSATGTAGNDQFFGGLGNDTYNGGDGADFLAGDAGNDTLNGGNGTDRFDGGAGADAFNGGAGIDRVDYNVATTLILNGAGVAQAGSSVEAVGDTFTGIEHIRGSALADTINVSTAVPILSGFDGDDTLTGGVGTNEILGGEGNDTLHGGGANGTAMAGDFGAPRTVESLAGGNGNDTIHVETLAGQTAYAYGDAGSDTIHGGAGHDIIFGGADADTLNGNDGNDSINAGSGGDIVDAGGGNDTMTDDDGMSGDSYVGGAGSDGIVYSVGSVFNFSAAGADTYDTTIEYVRFTNAATVTGSAGIDRFNGTGNNADTFSGLGGNDWLVGFGGNDTLDGGADNDRLDGGLGADTLRGGAGSDVLTGGNAATTSGDGAADTFFYAVSDIGGVDGITDFEIGLDKIGIDAASFGLTAGALESSRFMTLAAYQGGAANAISGDVFVYNSTNGRLYWDADGATAGGLTLVTILQNNAALSAGDFVAI